jgi:DNA-binding response OmpR family regulator
MMTQLIAVVDDDIAVRDIIAEVLADSYYPVVCYADGESFFDEMDRVRPTLLILDIELEHRISGWEILQELRGHPTANDMPIILSTTDPRFVQKHSDQIDTLTVTVLDKPFEIDALLDTVAQALFCDRARRLFEGHTAPDGAGACERAPLE